MPQTQLNVFWIRRDFRLLDNPALYHAVKESVKSGTPILPVFILDPGILDQVNIGYPRRYSLSRILSEFALKWPRFWIVFDKPENFFDGLADHFELKVFANDDIEPYARTRDMEVYTVLHQHGSEFQLFQDQVSVDLEARTQSGNLYSVFTPFRNAVIEEFVEANVYGRVDPSKLPVFKAAPPKEIEVKLLFDTFEPGSEVEKTVQLKRLQEVIFKKIDRPWEVEIMAPKARIIGLDNLFERPDLRDWYFTEEAAWIRFNGFLENDAKRYKVGRDDLELDTDAFGHTSRMSLGLKWGLVSARSLKQAILKKYGREGVFADSSLTAFLNELIWREFYKYILYHVPEVVNLEYQERFRRRIQWVEPELGLKRFEAWIKGETGYAIVDASMKQLAGLGWMHNRGRMIVASVLSKNLGVDWRWGQAYFEAMLVDHDLASNNGGWQWAASVGADPKPIRIFNPYLQAEKFDPHGVFQKRWLGEGYTNRSPIVEHKDARAEALKRYGLEKEK